MKADEFLPIFSQIKKDKEQGGFEDFLECLKLYDKEENGKMMAAELSHTLLSLGKHFTWFYSESEKKLNLTKNFSMILVLGERLADTETDELLKDCLDTEDDDGFVPYERKFSQLNQMKFNFLFPVVMWYHWENWFQTKIQDKYLIFNNWKIFELVVSFEMESFSFCQL